MEEAFFDWKFCALIGAAGEVVGCHGTTLESTRYVFAERQSTAILELGQQLSGCTNVEDFWIGVVCGLDVAEQDVPFALLYSVPYASSRNNSINSGHTNSSIQFCKLEGIVALSRGIPGVAPEEIFLDCDDYCLAPYLRQAAEELEPVVVSMPEVMQSALKDYTWRGSGTPSTTVVIYPIKGMAYLILALNPHRHFEGQYQDFIDIFTQRIMRPQLSSLILRQELDKSGILMRNEAIARAKLSYDLSESEKKLAKYSTRAPVGIAILDLDGICLAANALWQELIRLGPGDGPSTWNTALEVNELEAVMGAWQRVLTEKEHVAIDITMSRKWTAPDLDEAGNPQMTSTFLMLTLYPDFDETGDLATIMSCVSDVSQTKWSEVKLRQKMEQAIEMKKQQEKFIDMTSHEMRNPLSALIGCADEIARCLDDCYKTLRDISRFDQYIPQIKTVFETSLGLLDEAGEAAGTIIYCALHQKRIVDDILTLSKLDASLLDVAPSPSRPVDLVRGAFKSNYADLPTVAVFDAECKRSHMKLELIEQPSLCSHDVQWVLVDPGRFVQVLLNLLTNSIKFTRAADTRHITVFMGASLQKPSILNEFGVQYVELGKTNLDRTNDPRWGNGEVLYLSIAVHDTGKGLSEKEVKNLFALFTQASPKTYTKYGGSGLGLFISRQLVEMQGGEIGAKSYAGQGSTFCFYVKTRRSNPGTDHGIANLQVMVREDTLREAYGCSEARIRSHSLASRRSLKAEHSAPHILSPLTLYVLVVEDNLVNQKVIRKQLVNEDCVVYIANHGKEALDVLDRSIFSMSSGDKLDLILMDIEMPIMNGIECVKIIREMEADGKLLSHVPIIAVTANARPEQVRTYYNAGMDDVIVKPYRIQDMILQLRAVVGRFPGQNLTQ
ncbi:hypothetical protein BJ878DRAFT_459757 [Calycina marina]|uniref:histidine kinase n=1 Tax=Calycina marina TaxID=1763456 RepID=A0A9P8CGR5_9HELO|nr:hypothetical protein BJ878DRAFT_459757 [Calycina marina]